MSKGNPIIKCRIDPAMLQAMVDYVASSNNRRKSQPWTLSTFIQSACREKLAHIGRSRKSCGRKRTAMTDAEYDALQMRQGEFEEIVPAQAHGSQDGTRDDA